MANSNVQQIVVEEEESQQQSESFDINASHFTSSND
jgi:hypothetical protein